MTFVSKPGRGAGINQVWLTSAWCGLLIRPSIWNFATAVFSLWLATSLDQPALVFLCCNFGAKAVVNGRFSVDD
jgi:hypothetical protein